MRRDVWAELSDSKRRQWARSLLDALPSGFSFVDLKEVQDGLPYATFELRGATFIAVPGGPCTIGFDVDRWVPSADESESYRATRRAFEEAEGFFEEPELPPTIEELVARDVLAERELEAPFLLVERKPVEIGWVPITEQEVLAHLRVTDLPTDPGTHILYVDGAAIRARVASNRTRTYERDRLTSHADLLDALLPLRPPTGPEWEYLASGGRRSLFRWGDHAPVGSYPSDLPAVGTRWASEWNLDRDAQRSRFEEHWAPNDFGLLFGGDPHRYEIVDQPEDYRGGDGGTGRDLGGFIAWISLASSYYNPGIASLLTLDASFVRGRRVWALP